MFDKHAALTQTPWIIDTQVNMRNASGGEVNLSNVSSAWNMYRRVDCFLQWRFQYYFSAAPSSTGGVMVFKLVRWGGVDLSIDTAKISNGDASTNLNAAVFGQGHFIVSGGHQQQTIMWCGSTIVDATERKKYVKFLNAGGGNILDTALASGTHVFAEVILPIVGW